MTKYFSLSPKPLSYSSILWFESQTYEGVRFAIRRISLGLRIELAEKVRELSLKDEFLSAGSVPEMLEASLADLAVQRLLIEWGLVRVDGILINKELPTTELLIAEGPENLVNEILEKISGQLSLSDSERKNS